VLTLAHVGFHELGIALLQLVNPRGQGRLSHETSSWSGRVATSYFGSRMVPHRLRA